MPNGIVQSLWAQGPVRLLCACLWRKGEGDTPVQLNVGPRPTLYGHQRRAIPVGCDVAGSEWHINPIWIDRQRDSSQRERCTQTVKRRPTAPDVGAGRVSCVAFPGAWIRGEVRPSALDKQSRSRRPTAATPREGVKSAHTQAAQEEPQTVSSCHRS